MFIVRNKISLVVVALTDTAPLLDAGGLTVGATRFLGITSATHEIVEGDGPVVEFIPGRLTYDTGWVVVDQAAYDATLAARTPPVTIPEEISDRQFFQALAMAQLITKEEAIAAVATGAVPAAMEAFFSGMTEDEEFSARMLLQGAVVFHRHHPLVEAFGALQGMTSAQIDGLWVAAAAL